MPSSYPLATLYEARKRAVEKAESLLAQSSREYETAVQRQIQASEQRVAARARVLDKAQLELQQACSGRVVAGDLLTGAAYRQGAQAEFDRIKRQERQAKADVERRRASLDRARGDVVMARQDLAIVERHRLAFLDKLRKTEEMRADEHAAEVWQANHSKVPPEGLG